MRVLVRVHRNCAFMTTAIILNKGASTLKTQDIDALVDDIRTSFETAGKDIDVRLSDGGAIRETLDQAIKDDAVDTVIVGGGDGTVSLAAGLLLGTGKTLGVLPAGNMNFFAQSLGMPLELPDAVAALADAATSRADVGFANDRPFIHEFSLGLHPEMIELRDKRKYGSKIGKLVGNLRAMAALVVSPPRVRVWLDEKNGDGAKPLVTPALIISNNLYGEGHLPFADSLDKAVLGIYIVTSRQVSDVAALAASIHNGTWQQLDHVDVKTAKTIRLDRRRSMKASIDGELVKMRGPIVIRSEPAALPVLVPARKEAETGDNVAA